MYRSTATMIAATAALVFGLTGAGNALAGGWSLPPATTTNHLRATHPTRSGTSPQNSFSNPVTAGRITCPRTVREGIKQSSLPSGWAASPGGKLLQLAAVRMTTGREAAVICDYKERGPDARYTVYLYASRPVPRGLTCKPLGNGFYCRRSR